MAAGAQIGRQKWEVKLAKDVGYYFVSSGIGDFIAALPRSRAVLPYSKIDRVPADH
jgi:hypothetical protein